MLPRLARISLLLFQALWLNVIIPGHTRGALTLPSTSAASGCCSHQDHKKSPSKPTNDPARCAICFFAARLTVPETIDLTPPPLELVALTDAIHHAAPDHISKLAPFDGRAPPLA